MLQDEIRHSELLGHQESCDQARIRVSLPKTTSWQARHLNSIPIQP
jgi:hypothetical protein